MFKNKVVRRLSIVMALVFSFAFYFGIFTNPNFNIHDFCMNLAADIIWLVVTVILVDAIIKAKTNKVGEANPAKSKEQG